MFRYPGHEHESALVNVDEKSLDWEFYMAELTRENEGLFGQTNTSVTNEDEMTKMKTNFEVQYEKAKKDIEQKMHAQREEYEKKLKSLQTEKVEHEWTEENFEEFLREYQRENAQQEVEFERERKRIFDMEKVIKRRKVIVKKLQKKLLKVASMVSELNLMSAELNRKVKFFLDLGPGYLEDDSVLFAITDIIRVKVINEEYNLLYYWGLNKLNDRYFLIRDVLDEFFDTDQLPQVENDKDPFWDPEEPIDVGRCFLSFKPLSLLFDTEKTLRIYKETETVGTIHVKICPCSKAGDPLDEEEVQDYTDPMQLLGTNVHFYIEITKANINPFYTKQCYFQYRLNHDDFAEKIFKTERLQSESGVMDFAFKETHTLNKLDESGLIFLTESKVAPVSYLA